MYVLMLNDSVEASSPIKELLQRAAEVLNQRPTDDPATLSPMHWHVEHAPPAERVDELIHAMNKKWDSRGRYVTLTKVSELTPGAVMVIDQVKWRCMRVAEEYSRWVHGDGGRTASWPHDSLQQLMDGGLVVQWERGSL